MPFAPRFTGFAARSSVAQQQHGAGDGASIRGSAGDPHTQRATSRKSDGTSGRSARKIECEESRSPKTKAAAPRGRAPRRGIEDARPPKAS